MNYKKRIADDILTNKLNTFGGVLIVGPKGCGKTTTAKMHSNSYIEFQDETKREQLLITASIDPARLLIGEKPRLFDEWQDAPKIWGAIRKSIDDEQNVGLYILTGSTSKNIKTPHTGTMRISTMTMYPFSLFETNESNGTISLSALFDNPNLFMGCNSDLSLNDIIYAICRGGWPSCFKIQSKENKLEVARDLLYQTCNKDISSIDGQKRNPKWAETIIKSYSRNICTLCSNNTILKDVNSTCNISQRSFYDYLEKLEQLYIIDDIDAWCPSIRSKTAIRSGKKRNFIDPSIAVAAMGINPEYFNNDFKTLGFLFESLCIRDLKIYSSKLNGQLSYYRDRYGLEADAVLHLKNGKYALIEIKLGQNGIDEGAKHLCEIEKLIVEYNKKEHQTPIRLPDLKIVITGTQYGYKRDDGVFVIPIGCLKD